MKKILISVLLVTTCMLSATFYSPITKINFVGVYNTTTSKGGDVIFRLENSHEDCYGYYIQKDDVGFEATYSAILSAYHAKNDVRVYTSTTFDKWSGSTNMNGYCKVYTIQYR